MPRIITLLTDFGLSDTYAGQMKGAILAINPDVTLVDLTHEVPPQDVRQGAFLLETAIGAFPPDAVHLAVVDPGVGTERRALALRGPRGWFVGPDNGLLSVAVDDAARPTGREAARVSLPAGTVAVSIENPALQRETVSTTFHGRDIFGPCAAYLAAGVAIEAVGPRVDEMIALPPFRARRRDGGGVEATVVAIDRFGNLITDARAADLPEGPVTVSCAGQAIAGLSRTYGEGGALIALIGSSGYLEIAAPGGSAAAVLGATTGARVRIVPRS